MSSTRESEGTRIVHEWVEQDLDMSFESDAEFTIHMMPASLIARIDTALRVHEQAVRAEERERLIRVLGADRIADLAHHAIGVWQAFEDSHLFNNSPENGRKIRDAVKDIRQIAATVADIRHDDTAAEREG